jgi:hypothetical protein
MPSAGILILLVAVGTWACVKGRAAGAAAGCAALTVLFVVATPVGSGVPGVVAALFSVLDRVTTPLLNDEGGETAGPASDAPSVGSRTAGVASGGRR